MAWPVLWNNILFSRGHRVAELEEISLIAKFYLENRNLKIIINNLL